MITVIGGGFSGLSAAYFLHRAGKDVTLLEWSRSLGGRASTRNVGYRTLDAGAQRLDLSPLSSNELETNARSLLQAVIEERGVQSHLLAFPGPVYRFDGRSIATAEQVEVPSWSYLDGGMKILAESLVKDIPIRTHSRISDLIVEDKGTCTLRNQRGEKMESDEVVIALPAPYALALLLPHADKSKGVRKLVDQLNDVHYEPMIGAIFGTPKIEFKEQFSALFTNDVTAPVFWLSQDSMRRKLGVRRNENTFVLQLGAEISREYVLKSDKETFAAIERVFEEVLDVALPDIVYGEIQRWPAAFLISSPFSIDTASADDFGVPLHLAGDYIAGQSSLASAFWSGKAIADRILGVDAAQYIAAPAREQAHLSEEDWAAVIPPARAPRKTPQRPPRKAGERKPSVRRAGKPGGRGPGAGGRAPSDRGPRAPGRRAPAGGDRRPGGWSGPPRGGDGPRRDFQRSGPPRQGGPRRMTDHGPGGPPRQGGRPDFNGPRRPSGPPRQGGFQRAGGPPREGGYAPRQGGGGYPDRREGDRQGDRREGGYDRRPPSGGGWQSGPNRPPRPQGGQGGGYDRAPQGGGYDRSQGGGYRQGGGGGGYRGGGQQGGSGGGYRQGGGDQGGYQPRGGGYQGSGGAGYRQGGEGGYRQGGEGGYRQGGEGGYRQGGGEGGYQQRGGGYQRPQSEGGYRPRPQGSREGGGPPREGGFREGGFREGGSREGGYREGGHREGGHRDGGYRGGGGDYNRPPREQGGGGRDQGDQRRPVRGQVVYSTGNRPAPGGGPGRDNPGFQPRGGYNGPRREDDDRGNAPRPPRRPRAPEDENLGNR